MIRRPVRTCYRCLHFAHRRTIELFRTRGLSERWSGGRKRIAAAEGHWGGRQLSTQRRHRLCEQRRQQCSPEQTLRESSFSSVTPPISPALRALGRMLLSRFRIGTSSSNLGQTSSLISASPGSRFLLQAGLAKARRWRSCGCSGLHRLRVPCSLGSSTSCLRSPTSHRRSRRWVVRSCLVDDGVLG